jgi:heat shock protein beta
MDEPVDEYTAPAIQEVDGMEPLNIMRENAKIPESPGFQALAASEDMKGLKEWFETTFDGQISKATVSNKLVTSPAGCSVSQYGYTGNMQRITKAQAMQSGEAAFDVGMMGKTTFEFNPYHPIVKEINTRRKADADDAQAKTMALLLLDSAKIASGYDITEADAFAKRIHNLVSLSLNIDPTAAVAKEHEEVEEEPSEEEDEEEEEAEDLNE